MQVNNRRSVDCRHTAVSVLYSCVGRVLWGAYFSSMLSVSTRTRPELGPGVASGFSSIPPASWHMRPHTQERARQWRIAKGEATATDLKGPVGPATRESWMTDLPVARSGAAQPPKVCTDIGGMAWSPLTQSFCIASSCIQCHIA